MRRAEMKCIVAAGTLALACIPPAALAQAYPGKPIRIMIPFVAGGSSDIVGRAIGSKFQEFLRQPAVVENRPGANGAIAAEFVAKSEADGYTILVGSIGVFSINAALFKDLRYQPLRDFAPITLAVTTPNVLIAKPTLPPNSVKELVELAKKNPGRLAYCSSGSGSSDHLTGEVFRQSANLDRKSTRLNSSHTVISYAVFCLKKKKKKKKKDKRYKKKNRKPTKQSTQ